jgi:hypothetical protein
LNPLNSTWVNITGMYYVWKGGVKKMKKKKRYDKEREEKK